MEWPVGACRGRLRFIVELVKPSQSSSLILLLKNFIDSRRVAARKYFSGDIL